ncbi:outer membrane beta-barrel protein [Xanthomonas tesorieronis]|uniref:outer membrane beta-barrel protein n=1 Tax=Xanthomonas tesorieronis TaxID=3160839 RepID=UPI003516BFB7
MRNTLILAAMLAAAPFAAHAEGLSYSYVEGGWNRTDINVDETSEDIDGGYLRGSWQIAEPVYVFAGYQRDSDDFTVATLYSSKVTVQQASLGIGYRQEMTERVDFTADVSVLRVKAEADLRENGRRLARASDSNTLGTINVGLRGKPSPRTEAWVKAGYIDGSDVDQGEFVGTVGGQVNFTRTWGLVGEVEFIDNANQYKVGVRASF